ncbi:uncharacterized protein LOC123507177 isoform X2 [Portunus trituberculatus]|uniref:uncharacterized protein LOC123507177 isoform X2 n=1 Tax=Portunus trituberculatus TaxID=210409 RepID=UPI001E1CE0F6|nr:uncharacterized protein LOC123507177 isoform X2 [Portunus trituberculatus]
MYENLVDGASHSKKKKEKEKKKATKVTTQDIELDTFGQSSPPPYTPRGYRIETTWGRAEEDDSRSTPLVLRGSAAPREGKAEGERERKSVRGTGSSIVTSGSRGGHSSWAYVNLAFEKDADLILSPGTLKKRMEERTAAEKERKGEIGEKTWKKGDTVDKWREQTKKETDGKSGDTGTRRKSEGRDVTGLQTFRGVKGSGDTAAQSNKTAGDKGSTTLGRKKIWISSSSLRSPGEGGEKEDAAKSENKQDRKLQAEGEEGAAGFRLKHLTKEWDKDVGEGARKAEEGEGRDNADGKNGTVEKKQTKPENKETKQDEKEKDSEGEQSASQSPRRSPVLLSRFSTSTKLLLPQEEEEEEVEEASLARTLDRGYTHTHTLERRGGWREGQITFFDEGKKRDFNYFSAR